MELDLSSIVALAVGVLSLILLVVAITKLSALSNNVNYLADQIQGAGMTSSDLGQQVGDAIGTSLEKYMPKPENTAAAITNSVQETLKTATANVEDLHQRVIEAQEALLEKWASYETKLTTDFDGLAKSMDAAAKTVQGGLAGAGQQATASFDESAKKLNASIQGYTEQTSTTFGSAAQKLNEALKNHAEKAATASQQLTAQLEKIAALEQNIGNLLQLQQATEKTMQGVANSEEFKALVKDLRTHLAASDQALKEIAKPRRIRLVEQGG